ncbi:MAG: ABC transporter ATP-binding protein/permease [Muribaculaceae bacterium]|nr:ABC transporter ATP-binding protein/permease [Muribaculaceae bacterium]
MAAGSRRGSRRIGMIKQLAYIFNRKEKIKILLLFIVAIFGSILECASVSIFQPFVNVFMDSSVIQENKYLNYVYQLFGFHTTEGFMTALAGGIIAIFVIKNLYLIIEKYAIYTFSYNTQMKISTGLLRAYVSEPYTFHLNKNISVLQRSVQEDSDLFTKAIIHFMELVVEIMVCFALGIYLFDVSKSITVIVVCLLVVCVGIFTAISRKFARELGKDCQEYKAKLYQWMNQALGGIKEVKVLNRELFFINSYSRYFKKYSKGLKISKLIGTIPKYIVEMVSIAGLLLALIVKMNYGHSDMAAFVPQLAAFAVAAFRLLPSIGRINEHMTGIMYAAPSIELVYHDLKEVENIKSLENSEKGTLQLEKELVIKDVCYHYPDNEENVIDFANFVIKKGQAVAFIGESGAGKTTMADIILGLLTPQYGRIKADQTDIFKNMDIWHHSIGYIPQTIYLSDDTIRNNVAFGVEEDQIDEMAVENALVKAQLWNFVEGLSDGLETVVGDRGVRLSGGQRQRIGIARALYHNPEILILDEATSALDNETESAVMEAIEKLRGEKTMIIIAHRLTTIQNADVIYEVIDGKVEKRDKQDVLK